MDLTDIHQAQVSRFVSFFKGKRETAARDRQVFNEQFNDDYLSDDTAIFNIDNVKGIVGTYQSQALENLGEEIDKILKLAAVYCTELMRAAQAQGVNLQTEDISIVEDQNRIDHVNAIMTMGRAPPLVKQNTLPSLGASPGGSDPAMLAQKLQESQEHSRMMEQRNQAMQTQVTSLLQERSSLSSELDTARGALQQMRSQMASVGADAASQQAAAELEQRLYHSQTQIVGKTAEVEAMRRDYESRLGDSSQFRKLKDIIKEKNGTIKTLRGQLQALGYAVDNGGDDLIADDD